MTIFKFNIDKNLNNKIYYLKISLLTITFFTAKSKIALGVIVLL
jgi:hypothetical protein